MVVTVVVFGQRPHIAGQFASASSLSIPEGSSQADKGISSPHSRRSYLPWQSSTDFVMEVEVVTEETVEEVGHASHKPRQALRILST